MTSNSVKPFIVAIFYGKGKPDVHEYLKEFCEEISFLHEHGIVIDGKKLDFNIRAIIADVPARSFIRQTVGHGAYFACDRCEVKGTYKNHSMSYEKLYSTCRTHISFINKTPTAHHVGISPFATLNCLDNYD